MKKKTDSFSFKKNQVHFSPSLVRQPRSRLACRSQDRQCRRREDVSLPEKRNAICSHWTQNWCGGFQWLVGTGLRSRFRQGERLHGGPNGWFHRGQEVLREREEIFFYGCNLSFFVWFSVASSFALESLLLIPPYNNIEQGYDMIII